MEYVIPHQRSLNIYQNYANLYRFLENLENQEDHITPKSNFYDHVHKKPYHVEDRHLREFFNLLNESLIEGANLYLWEIPQTYSLPYVDLQFPVETNIPFIKRNLEAILKQFAKCFAKAIKKEQDIEFLVLYTAEKNNYFARILCVSNAVTRKTRKELIRLWSVSLLPILQKKIHPKVQVSGDPNFIRNYEVFEHYEFIYDVDCCEYICEEKYFPSKKSDDRNVGCFIGELSINYVSPMDKYFEKKPLVLTVEEDDDAFAPDIKIDQLERELDEACMRDTKVLFLRDVLEKILLPAKFDPKLLITALADKSTHLVLARWIAKRSGIDDEELDELWSANYLLSPASRKYTSESIYKWARKDFKTYIRVAKESAKNKLTEFAYKNGGKIGQSDAAQILAMIHKGRFFVDVSGKQYTWLEFVYPNVEHDPHELWKWRMEVDPDNLHKYIANEFRDLYNDVLRDLRERVEENGNPALTRIIKRFTKCRDDLSEDTPQQKIVKQGHYYFRQRGVLKDMDEDGNVLGVLNGVLHLGEEIELIDYPHEYKISKCAPTKYVPYDPNCPMVQRLEQIFLDSFGSVAVREWFLVLGASQLDGNLKADVLVNMVGPGSNGKSIYLGFLDAVLGDDYYFRGGIEILCDKRIKQGQANPAMMRFKKRRGACFTEADENEAVRGSNLKNVASSGDKIDGRDLYSGQENFRNTVQSIVATNQELIANSHDEGFWRRLKIFYMPFIFTKNPTRDTEKIIDETIKTLKDKPEWRSAFLAILTDRYKIYKTQYKGSILTHVPDEIEAQTEQYRSRYDTLSVFIKTCLKETNNEQFLLLRDIAQRYSEWYPTYTGIKKRIDLRQVERDLRISGSLHTHIESGHGDLLRLRGFTLLEDYEK